MFSSGAGRGVCASDYSYNNKVGGAQQPHGATHVVSVSGSLKRLVVSSSCPLYKHRVSYNIIGLGMSLLTYFQKLSNQKEQPELCR